MMPKEVQGLVLLSLVDSGWTPKCAKLLQEILRQTRKQGDQWIFDGSVTTIAHTLGINLSHSKTCIARLVQSGVLASTGRSNGMGKPKEYWVRESWKNGELAGDGK